MRHLVNRQSFGRRIGPRTSLFRNLVNALVEHGRISTTVTKAKALRSYAEKAVTLSKKKDFNARRLLLKRFPNKDTVNRLLEVWGPFFKDRNGGYTRVIRVGMRQGDNAPLAFIEFLNYQNAAPIIKDEGKKVKAKSEPSTNAEAKPKKKAPANTHSKNEKIPLKKKTAKS